MTFRALRLPRFRLRFVDALPGCGLRVYRIARGPARAAPALRAQRLPGGGAAIENEQVRLEARGDGSLRLIDRQRGDAIEDVLRVVSEGDRGDEYNFDPVPGGERVERPARVRVKLGPVSEAEVSLAIDARYRVPAGARPGPRRARAAQRLAAGEPAAPALPRAAAGGGPDRRATTRRGIIGCGCTCGRPSRRRASRWSRPSRSRSARSRPRRASFGSERPSEFPIGATPAARLRHARGGRARAQRREPRLRGGRGGAGGRHHLPRAHAAARGRLALARRSRAASDPRRSGARDAGRAGPGAAPRGARASGCTRTATRSAAPTPTASARPPGCSRPTGSRTRRSATARGCSRSTIPRWWCPRSSRARRARR